ncbi:MAG: hypothetical protein H6742_08970 [Alphaproteobacteria bacterium]|nr:hypothetical protein [Alphaproteobacteria bacterium]
MSRAYATRNTPASGKSSGGDRDHDKALGDVIDLQTVMGNGALAAHLLEQAGEDLAGPGWLAQFEHARVPHEQLQQIVEGDDRKQQDTPLPALREKHEGSEYQDFEDGVAFVKGAGDAHEVDPNDAKQGALGDCYLIAGMIAVARANPQAIKDIVKDNGDGTFDITLYIRTSYYGRPRPETITVDARLPVKGQDSPLYAKQGDQEGGQDELWVALIEKAVAQKKASYELISGGNINGNGFSFAGATELLTGKRENYYSFDGLDKEDILLMATFALEDNKPVICSTRSDKEDDEQMTREANGHNVYWNHAYPVESVDLDKETISFQNPWGSHHVKDLPIADVVRFYKSIRIGG